MSHGVNCAKNGQVSTAVTTDDPEVVLAAADANHMPNQGFVEVTTKSRERSSIERVFYKAAVDMSVLSVAEWSKEEPQGSNTSFRQRAGIVEDNQSKTKQHFIKLKGGFFMSYIPAVVQRMRVVDGRQLLDLESRKRASLLLRIECAKG